MKLKTRLAVTIGWIALATLVIAFRFNGDTEPSFAGRSLSQWLEQTDLGLSVGVVPTQDAANAVRQMDHQLVAKTAIKWLDSPDPWINVRLRQNASFTWSAYRARRRNGMLAFLALGEDAKQHIHSVISLALTSPDGDVRSGCICSLGASPNTAVTELRSILQTGSTDSRLAAVRLLGDIRWHSTSQQIEKNEIIECLTIALSDDIERIQIAAVDELRLNSHKFTLSEDTVATLRTVACSAKSEAVKQQASALVDAQLAEK